MVMGRAAFGSTGLTMAEPGRVRDVGDHLYLRGPTEEFWRGTIGTGDHG